MSFFEPAYLWAALILGAVLFIHLFRQRSVKRLDISTLRFFSASAQSASRAKNIRRILLLLTRLLLISTLILIFAGLYNRENPLVKLQDPRSVVYTWVDPTVSMEYVENGKTLIENAGAVLDSFVATLPSSVKHFNYHHSNGHFIQISRGEEADLETRFGPVDLKRAVETYLYEEKSEKSSLVLVSDFQKSTADVLDSLSEKIVSLGKTVVCVSVSPDKAWNHSVKVVGQPGGGSKIAAEVHARGRGVDSARVAALFSSLRAGQVRVDVKEDDSARVVLSVPTEVSGSSGKIGLELDDPLAFDNTDHFSPRVERSRSVLIVGSREQNKVIAAALKVSPGSWEPIELKEGGELTYDDLNSADLVIVNGFGGHSRMLESFLSGSGVAEKGIVLCLDPDAEHDFVSGLLRKRIAGSMSIKELEKGVHPVLTDTVSELWQGFPGVRSQNARIYRYLNPLAGNVLVGLENRGVLASQLTVESGRWIVLSSPLGVTSANNLCETGFYLPLVDRLAQQALLKERSLKEIWYAGYSKHNPFYGREQDAALYDENEKLVSTWSTQPFVSVDKPGLYKLVPAGGESFELAVTWHPSESEMLFVPPSEDYPENIYYFKASKFLEQIRDLANNVWSYVLWILLGLFTCSEVLFWHVGSGKKAGETLKR